MGVKERYEDRKKKGETASYSGVRERSIAKEIYGIASSISERTNTWLKNHRNYLTNYNYRYSGRKGTYEDSYVSDASDWLSTISKQKENFDKEASSILSMLDEYGDYLNADWTDSIRSALTTASSQQADILSAATGDSEYWSSFGSDELIKEFGSAEEAYKYYQRDDGYQKKYNGKTYDELHAAMEALEDGEEKAWLSNYQYEPLKKSEDFAQYRQYANDSNGVTKYLSDPTYEYINGKLAFAFYDALAGAGADYNYVHMNEDEISIYNYLYAKEGRKKAEEYLNSLKSTLVAREKQDIKDDFSAFAKKLPVISSVASVPISLLSGYEYVDNAIKYLAEQAVTGDAKLDPSYAALATGTIRGTVSDMVDWEIGNWDAFDFLYSTVMSGADSLVSGLAFGNFGGAVLGLTAAAQATNDALERGMSDGQAFWNGLVSGVFEGLFETVSIGNFNKLKEIAPDRVKTIIKNLGKSMLVNASEETLTELANITYDTLINGEFANYTWGELKNGAWKDALAQVIEAGASGALMGVGMSGIGNAIGYYKGNKSTKSTYGKYQGDLVGESLEINPNNDFAQKMQRRIDNGKDLSGWQLNKLVQQNEQAMMAQDMESIRSAAAQRLTELGETGDVDTIASALAKKAAGQKLSSEERNTISLSKYGERVSNELNAENIHSGDYSSSWTGSIDTNRINAKEYGSDLLMELAMEKSGVKRSAEESSDSYASMENPASAGENTVTSKGNLTANVKKPSETGYDVSADGKTILKSNGEDVSIREVSSVKDGKMTLRLEDGREVSSEDVSYASRDEALVYETVANMGVNASEANVLVNAFHTGTVDADTYTLGIQEAYRYGKYNYTVQEMLERGSFASMLTEHQRKTAYKLGQVFSGRETAKAQAEVRSKQTDSAKNTNSKKGGVLYESRDGAVSELDSYLKESGKELKPIQKTAIQTMKMLSDVFGIKFYVFESYKNSEGERVWKDSSSKERSINGYYDQSDGSIHIDLNAGADGKGTMLFTMAHELTHFIKQWSPAKFKVLANFLMKQYGENGVSVDALVRKRMKKTGLGYDAAYEEVVANSMESMLSDGNVAEKLAELKKQDRGLWNKIRQFINSWVDKLRAAYKGLTPDSLEGKIVYEMKDAAERLQTLFSEALAEAGENYQAGLTPGEESVVVSDNGDPVAYSNEYGSVKLSIRTYEEEGRQAFRDYLSKCVSSNKLTNAEMQEMMDGIEDIYQICKEFKDKYAPFGAWSDASVIRDTYGRPVFSVVTPNGEYKMNLDFSLVCKKRRTLDAVFNEMSRRGIIDYFELGQKSVVKINEIIRKYGFETACALCFVDAKRFRQASMADSFTNLYNELVTSLVPEDQIGSIDHFNFSGYETIKKVPDGIHTWDSSKLDFSHLKDVMKNYGNGTVEYKAAKYILSHPEGRKLLLRGDFMSSNGFDAVKTHNKDILKLYNSKKGTGGPKAAFGDVQYMNEVIKKAKTWTPAKAYAVGGVRIQSFSDYVPRMVFDYVQMIYDLAATKLPAHAYTKESLFAKQFGLTGVKINMSLIPAIAKDGIAPGLDSKGNYVWAGESFDFDAAKQIQNAPGYSENCGTICVGVSYAHIVKLLSDPDIRMVIPYHKSGLNPIVAHMNKIAEFTDYTGSQNTLDGNGKKVAKDFDFNKELQSVGDPKAAVDNYLAWCDNKGYTPKFAEFRWHDNYYKLIEDFTLYDNSGSYVPQREVRAVFPTSESAFGSMKDLIKSGLEEDAVIEGKRDKNLSAIVDEIQNTLPRTEAEIAENEVAQADRDLESELADSGIKYSDRVTDEETLDFLNSQKTIKTYKTMQIVDGKLYPPMASRIEGKYEDYSVLGQWEQATEHPELIKENGKFKLDKGKGQGSIEAAYNPYMHSSNLVLNDQFSGAYSRDNLVTVECEVPVSEETSGYHAQYAKDSVGWHPWHTGTVAGSIRKAKGVERKVFLSRWIKPVRIVPDSEVASMYKELLSGTDVAVPDNVVTPSLLKELKKAGVKIEKSGRLKFSDREESDPSGIDTDSNLNYHKENANRQEVNGNERREESRESFYRRAHEKKYTVRERGQIAYGYASVANKTRGAGQTERNLKKLGIQVIVHDGLEVNANGITSVILGDATSVAGDVVYVRNSMKTDPMETAGHEAFHFWKHTDARIEYKETVAQNIVFSSDSFIQFQKEIADAYFGEEIGIDDDAVDKLTEEIFAYITGLVHAGDSNSIVSSFMRDYDAVKDAWGDFIKKQATSGDGRTRYSTRETDNIGTFDGSNPDILMQDRPEESVSNRSLLANALESTAKNDIERKKIQEYKEKIDLLNSEEQKLQELNAQVKELSFAKGPRDTAKIRALRDEAVKTANRINTYDRILLRLEASQPLQNVLEREKKAAYRKAEQKGKEALEAYRKDAIKKQQDILDRWQKSREKGIDSRNRTAMRHKIQNVVGELNQYLLKGTKDRHVPIELQKAVAEALDAVNMDTVGAEERIDKLKEELLKAKTAEQIQEISRKIERIQAMGDRMNDRLQALKDAYDKFTKSDDPLIANSHDDVISAKLDSVIDTVGDTPLRDMSLSQLKDVYDMYRMVLTTIRNANKAFKAKKSESISAMGNEVMMEVERAGGKTKLRLKGTGGISNFDWNNMKPVYAFERIGSDTLTELFNNVRSGEDTWAVDVTEAREYYLEKAKKYNYDSWDFNSRYTFTSTSGMEFSLSLEQILSLYAYSKREQASEHLKRGGIVFDETTEVTVKTKLGIPLKFNPTEATAYNISENTLADIIGKLSDEQKAFADEMQDYLSSVMGSKGNEVSLELYGIKLFNEKFYFPLKSAKQFMEKAREQQQGDTKIKNKGFSKDTVPKASNPIVLTPFMDVWADHVNEMSMYHAFVLPMEDFYRVYNFKTPVSETDAEKSVNMFLQNAYGKGATNYIDQLLKDLNGGARSDPRENTAKVLMSKFKKAAVMASLSVVIQQPSAIARAFAMIDPKYFRPTKDGMNHAQLWEELKKYAPVAVIKEMGYFDTNMGRSTNDFIKAKEYTGFKEKAKALFTDSGYRDELISKAPSLADEVTWCAIWNAVKRETVSKHHDLSPSSEEFLKLAGERFTEVVTKTQVYDSVLARSGNMRSKTAFMNMWTSFMAEPTTSINMVQDALLKAKRGDKRYAVKAIGSVCASVILNAALVSLVYAMRDDDDDETYLEKYVSRFLTETLDGLNPLTYIPFLRDVWSIMQGFDIDRADMSLVTDLVNSLQKIVKVMNTDTYGMDEDEIAEHNRKVAEAWLSAVDSISSLTGIPFRNFRRDLNGAVNLVKTLTKDAQGRQTTAGSLMDVILDDVKASTPIWGWMPGDSKADKLYDAIVSGDTAYVDRLKSGYDSEESYYSALRNAVKKRYVSGDISYETAMDFLIEQCGMSEDDAYWKLDEWNSGADGDDYRKYAEFYDAVQTGNNLKAVIKRYTDNGVKPETLSSQITDYFKPIYIEMSKSERASLKGYLRNAMVYCGSDDDAAMEKLQHWDFLADNPDYRDISQAEATKYYEYAEPNGISVSVYCDYCERASQCESDKDKNGNPIDGSKKKKILEVIDSLPITKKQKDALYYANGWSASTIYEAPWRR